jgi:hypothetical protein
MKVMNNTNISTFKSSYSKQLLASSAISFATILGCAAIVVSTHKQDFSTTKTEQVDKFEKEYDKANVTQNAQEVSFAPEASTVDGDNGASVIDSQVVGTNNASSRKVSSRSSLKKNEQMSGNEVISSTPARKNLISIKGIFGILASLMVGIKAFCFCGMGGLNPSKKDEYGVTPLMKNAMVGYDDYVKLFLKYPNTDVNDANDFGQTALHYAAMRGQDKVVRVLLKDPKIDLIKTDMYGKTAFDYGDYGVKKLILKKLMEQNGHYY